jgi:hypothetical protein
VAERPAPTRLGAVRLRAPLLDHQEAAMPRTWILFAVLLIAVWLITNPKE